MFVELRGDWMEVLNGQLPVEIIITYVQSVLFDIDSSALPSDIGETA